MTSPEDPSSSKFLPSITTYKDSLDLFISFKFRVEVTAKVPMLDWTAIKMSSLTLARSLLRSGICSNCEVFSQCSGSPQLLPSFHQPLQHLRQVFFSGAAEWFVS